MKKLFFSLLFAPLLSFSQSTNFQANVHYGFFWPHRTTMRHLVNDYAKGFNLSFEKALNNPIANANYDEPKWGVEFLFINPGNNELLGNTYSVIPYLRTNSIKRDRFSLTSQFGFGGGWVGKTYDRETNFKNTAIGSNFNLTVHLNSTANFKVTKNSSINLGLNFIHLSNGAMALPNLGLNIPTLNLGYQHTIGNENDAPKLKGDFIELNNLFAHFQFGMREVEPNSGEIFPNYNLSFEYIKRKNAQGSFLGILDLYYKTTLSERARIDTAINKEVSNFQIGLMGAYQKIIDPFSVFIGMGIYAFDELNGDGLFYHRLGVRYIPQKNYFVSFSIYSHFAKADHFQLGIGYKIK